MKYAAKRNYGYGRSMRYAIKNAIREYFNDGSYGSQRTHRSRLDRFVRYLKNRKIADLRHIDRAVVEDYGRVLKDLIDEEQLKVSTAQNCLSSVNVLMRFLRRDELVCVSPSRFVGRRVFVATDPPASMKMSLVLELVRRLIGTGAPRVGLAVLICRLLGTRIMESSLLDLRKALRGAKRKGVVAVTRGSKGNRAKKIPRVIEISGEHLELVEELISGIGEENVIPAGLTFRQWYDQAYKVMRPIAQQLGLASGFHDLRRAWACEKYSQITGCDAPCVAGCRIADRGSDQRAREWLCEALGHGRTQIASAYVGGIR